MAHATTRTEGTTVIAETSDGIFLGRWNADRGEGGTTWRTFTDYAAWIDAVNALARLGRGLE